MKLLIYPTRGGIILQLTLLHHLAEECFAGIFMNSYKVSPLEGHNSTISITTLPSWEALSRKVLRLSIFSTRGGIIIQVVLLHHLAEDCGIATFSLRDNFQDIFQTSHKNRQRCLLLSKQLHKPTKNRDHQVILGLQIPLAHKLDARFITYFLSRGFLPSSFQVYDPSFTPNVRITTLKLLANKFLWW